eukprot:evm.model.NODE_9598_length_9546_cov_21.099413.2
MEAVVQASIWSQNHDPQLHAAIHDSLKTEQPAGYDNDAELQRKLLGRKATHFYNNIY